MGFHFPVLLKSFILCLAIFSDVIHTVGPQVHSKVSEEQRNLLKSCYIESLNIATANNLRTIVSNLFFEVLISNLKFEVAIDNSLVFK